MAMVEAGATMTVPVLRSARVARGPYSRVIYDHAYLWPHFTPVERAVSDGNDTVALFTLSKMSGHASTRIGWALVSNPRVAKRMRKFVNTVTLGVPRESELKAVAALEHINTHHGEILTHARRRRMRIGRRVGRHLLLVQELFRCGRFPHREATGSEL